MVRAIQEGRKTQMRRVIKPQPVIVAIEGDMDTVCEWNGLTLDFASDILNEPKACPYGQPGDRLWPAMEIPSLGRNYCADTYGVIWSRARDGETWIRLKSSSNGKGYQTVTPAVDGKYRTRLVHRLVCEAFYGPPRS